MSTAVAALSPRRRNQSAAKLARPLSAPRDAQRILGTAAVRFAAGAGRSAAGVAALYRYRARLTRRHSPLGDRAYRNADDVCGAVAVRGPSRASARRTGINDFREVRVGEPAGRALRGVRW